MLSFHSLNKPTAQPWDPRVPKTHVGWAKREGKGIFLLFLQMEIFSCI